MNSEIEQLQAVVGALPDPVFILTESGRYAGIVGGRDPRYYHDGSGLVGRTLFEVLPRDKADWFLKQIHRAIKEQCLQTVEYGLGGEDVDGLDTEKGPVGTLWFEGRVQPLQSLYDGERAVVWVARNITKRYELESKLRRLTELDELTGVYNRRKLLSELKIRFDEHQRYHAPTSLLMIDIDHFKMVNDRFGHLAGDEILSQFAQASLEQMRSVDQLARFGGEEFAAILPHTQLPEAENIAERLRNAIQETIKMPNGEVGAITTSIGIGEMTEGDMSEEDILRRADEALYLAKTGGRNRVVVSS
jgi:diguanylate cyclase (GGDEF)-like protein